jgi:hypothetical protein
MEIALVQNITFLSRLVRAGGRSAVSGLTFTHRDVDEKKFSALCRSQFCAAGVAKLPSPRVVHFTG